MRLLDEVEELVEMINQWEIISPLVDKINSIGTELEEIILEQLIPKFNQIEKEGEKTEVIRIMIFLEFKGSLDPNHFIFEINVGKRRIRHVATYNDSEIE